MNFRILEQNENYVWISKPAGFHTHPHEEGHHVPRSRVVLAQLRDQINTHLYPVHRLDAGTSGVLVFAKSSSAAASYQRLSQSGKTYKKYLAICRGYLRNQSIEDELGSTNVTLLREFNLPIPTRQKGTAFDQTRLSLCLLEPKTGRYHQLRRHLARASHPLLGDSVHGDTKFNRGFKDWAFTQGFRQSHPMWLHAWNLEFEAFRVTDYFPKKWHWMFEKVGVCPWGF